MIDRKAYEICALSELRDRLRAGDVWVEGSRQFRDFESCLVPRTTFDALREENALPVAVETDGTAYLPARRQALLGRLAGVAGLGDGLGRSAYEALPRVKITDLLLEVDRWIGFSACFTHQGSGRPPEDRAALLTAILADGINLGLTRMAEACRWPASGATATPRRRTASSIVPAAAARRSATSTPATATSPAWLSTPMSPTNTARSTPR